MSMKLPGILTHLRGPELSHPRCKVQGLSAEGRHGIPWSRYRWRELCKRLGAMLTLADLLLTVSVCVVVHGCLSPTVHYKVLAMSGGGWRHERPRPVSGGKAVPPGPPRRLSVSLLLVARGGPFGGLGLDRLAQLV